MNKVQKVKRYQIRRGLQDIRDLVRGTHWIQGSYVTVQYEDGDGNYEDGAVVENSKVVGCLIGLSRLVAAKKVTYYKGRHVHVDEMPSQTALSQLMEEALQRTMTDEFLGGDYYREEDAEESADNLSIEGWNDYGPRTKDEVIALLDRTIELA